MNRIILLLDLEMKLQKNDIAFQVHQLVKSFPEDKEAIFIDGTKIEDKLDYLRHLS